MASMLTFILAALSVAISVPVSVFVIEVALGALQGRNGLILRERTTFHSRIAVVVPAHNESVGLLPTLADVKSQLGPFDRLLVVADNCTDDTAKVAAEFADEVIKREDLQRRGKGYALAAGFDHLKADPPDIVMVVDADCRLGERAIEILGSECLLKQRPVQALYLMTAPANSIVKRVSEFAWRVKNWARPLGARYLGLPCQLMGSGMAFPWHVISSVSIGGSLVEDLQLGLDLAFKGYPPSFCAAACVTSSFPLSKEGTDTQRIRWERGHIGTVISKGPRWIWMALSDGDLKSFFLVIDAAIPPLTVLLVAVVVVFAIAAISRLAVGASFAFEISTINLMAFIVGIFCAWWKFGRDIIPLSSMWLIAIYILQKLALYRRLFSKKSSSEWTRTKRD